MAQSIENLLSVKGLPVPEVAKKCGVSSRRIYQYSAAHNLPRNTPIAAGSSLERQIVMALVTTNMDVPAVARIYSQAPINIRNMVARIRKGAPRAARVHRSRR
jgi:predicted DNA-binding transcriptional regulator AlpA